VQKLFSCLLLLSCLPGLSQVVVSLQGKYKDALQNLDSIIVENVSQYSLLSLAAPPETTTYRIDLMNGSFLGISDLPSSPQVRIQSMMPGRISLNLNVDRSGTVRISLFALSGKLFRQWEKTCHAGLNEIDLQAGTNQLLVGCISGSDFTFSFKMTGSREVATSCTTGYLPGDGSFKGAPAFRYSPGDKVRFTAVKTGMNRGRTVLEPKNQDLIVINLSLPCPGIPTVTDYDGNIYPTVQIGNQCWLQENLRAKHYAGGQPLADGTGIGTISETDTTPYCFHMNDNPIYDNPYGLLYTAKSAIYHLIVNQQRDICPNGWHVSNPNDWCTLEKYLDSTYLDCSFVPSPQYIFKWGGTMIRDKISEQGNEHWTCTEFSSRVHNESGFTALPNCGRLVNGFFTGLGGEAVWWAGTPGGGWVQVMVRGIVCDSAGDYRTVSSGLNALPVRCVKN
jgi:uncharacterized protein (TIGR02145 family)